MNHYDEYPKIDDILIAITIGVLIMGVLALGVLIFNKDYNNIFILSCISILLITFSSILRYLIKHRDK